MASLMTYVIFHTVLVAYVWKGEKREMKSIKLMQLPALLDVVT